MRVQRVLADEEASTDRVVRVIGSEPILATQLLQIANSAALNPVGKPVTDLRTAVARVGLECGAHDDDRLCRAAAAQRARAQTDREAAQRAVAAQCADCESVLRARARAIRGSMRTPPCSPACCMASAACTS